MVDYHFGGREMDRFLFPVNFSFLFYFSCFHFVRFIWRVAWYCASDGTIGTYMTQSEATTNAMLLQQ